MILKSWFYQRLSVRTRWEVSHAHLRYLHSARRKFNDFGSGIIVTNESLWVVMLQKIEWKTFASIEIHVGELSWGHCLLSNAKQCFVRLSNHFSNIRMIKSENCINGVIWQNKFPIKISDEKYFRKGMVGEETKWEGLGGGIERWTLNPNSYSINLKFESEFFLLKSFLNEPSTAEMWILWSLIEI